MSQPVEYSFEAYMEKFRPNNSGFSFEIISLDPSPTITACGVYFDFGRRISNMVFLTKYQLTIITHDLNNFVVFRFGIIAKSKNLWGKFCIFSWDRKARLGKKVEFLYCWIP
jgi:hypothetical protein